MYTPSNCPGTGDEITHSAAHQAHPNGPWVDADDNPAQELADELYQLLAMTPDGKTCPKAMAEAIDDLCMKKSEQLAAAHDAGDYAEIGRLVSEHFRPYWEDRALDAAEAKLMQQSSQDAADTAYRMKAA